MLRSAGISARLVTGYSQGDLTSEPGERVMRGTDAHAWVQVWYPGIGWVNSDPTAAAILPVSSGHSALGHRSSGPAFVATGCRRADHARWSGGLADCARRFHRDPLLLCAAPRCVPSRDPGVAARPSARSRAQSGDGPVLQAYIRLDAALGGQAPSPNRRCARWRGSSMRRVARLRNWLRRWIVSSESATRSCRPRQRRSRWPSTSSAACQRH